MTQLIIKNGTHPGEPLRYGDYALVGYTPFDPLQPLIGYTDEVIVYRSETTETAIPDEMPDDGYIYTYRKNVPSGPKTSQNNAFHVSGWSDDWTGGGAHVTFNLLRPDMSIEDSIVVQVEA